MLGILKFDDFFFLFLIFKFNLIFFYSLIFLGLNELLTYRRGANIANVGAIKDCAAIVLLGDLSLLAVQCYLLWHGVEEYVRYFLITIVCTVEGACMAWIIFYAQLNKHEKKQ